MVMGIVGIPIPIHSTEGWLSNESRSGRNVRAEYYSDLVVRGCVYVVFVLLLFLMWAKPAEVVDDFTEGDSEGHILRVNGKPFIDYLAVLSTFCVWL